MDSSDLLSDLHRLPLQIASPFPSPVCEIRAPSPLSKTLKLVLNILLLLLLLLLLVLLSQNYKSRQDGKCPLANATETYTFCRSMLPCTVCVWRIYNWYYICPQPAEGHKNI